MARSRDNAPIGHTCPKIDDVISMVHDFYKSGGEMSVYDYNSFEKKMEQIRDANSTLREWGNEQNQLAEEYEKDLDDAKDEIADLRDEIKALKSEIRVLEDDLS